MVAPGVAMDPFPGFFLLLGLFGPFFDARSSARFHHSGFAARGLADVGLFVGPVAFIGSCLFIFLFF